jgi:hypothetical protein
MSTFTNMYQVNVSIVHQIDRPGNCIEPFPGLGFGIEGEEEIFVVLVFGGHRHDPDAGRSLLIWYFQFTKSAKQMNLQSGSE